MLGPGKLLDADIMVVDDQLTLLESAEKHLAPVFGAITTFFDPVKAAQHLRSGERYKAILLDVEMEPVSGLALLKLARQLDPTAQVIMISGNASTETTIKSLQLGAVDYILKPVDDWPHVVRILKRALEEWGLRAENARLLAELKIRNEELNRSVMLLKKLNETIEHMHGQRDVKEILNQLLRAASSGLTAARVSIMIRDPKDNEMAIHVAEGMDAAILKQVRVKPNEGIAGEVIARGVPVVVDDAEADERVGRGPRSKPYQGRSFMSIPIVRHGHAGETKIMGVVNVTDRIEDRPFSPSEVEFVLNLARHAALALTGAAVWQTISQLASSKK